MERTPIIEAYNISNILQINTTAFDGGAGRVMSRLHQQYLSRGLNSWIVNKTVDTPDQQITSLENITDWPQLIQRIHNSIAGRIDRWIGTPLLHRSTNKLLSSDYTNEADIIHFHNLHGRYFNYLLLSKFAEKKPIILTLHDMWSFTGHCTYSYDCDRWKSGCGKCPLFSPNNREKIHPPATLVDLTNLFWKSKKSVFNRLPIHIVTPSKWLHKLSRESFLGEKHIIHHIPNGVDLNTFQPLDKRAIRYKMGIQQDISVILFIASDINLYRKGIKKLLLALRQLLSTLKIHLLIVGKQSYPDLDSLQFPWTHLGQIKDEHILNEVYNASDIFAFPSLADNHPLVALESIASGTPVIAFETGGIPEIVFHKKTGYLAKYADSQDFAYGIQFLLSNSELLSKLKQQSREIALKEFSLNNQVERYLSLYQNIAFRENKKYDR